jgi:prepilin-type N-terminal cleavage/methylation domain-containing protein
MSLRVRGRLLERTRQRAVAPGFSLMELMVVVLLVAVMAMIAVPTLSSARFDRHCYEDAGYVLELFRAARTRALARGGAVLVHMKADNGSQHGRFEVWEAVTADIGDGGTGAFIRTPMSSCKTPTVWTLTSTSTSSFFVDAVDMNGKIEQEASIFATVYDPAAATVSDAYICFTPLGHVYYSTTNTFDATLPLNGVVQVWVTQNDATQASGYRGIQRRVVIPSSGMPRIISL